MSETEPRTENDPNEAMRSYENWSENYSDEDPYDADDEEKRHPDDVPPSEYEYDEDGGYNPAAGSQSRDAALDAGRCGAELKNCEERYGEERFCTRLPEAAFVENGSEMCRIHKDSDT